MITNCKLADWLKSKSTEPFLYSGKLGFGILMRVEYDKDFDLLYFQRRYSEDDERSGKYEYAGIYCRKDGYVYNSQSHWIFILDKEDITELVRALPLVNGVSLQDAVCEKVDTIIGGDRANLQVKEISDYSLRRRDLEYFKLHEGKRIAREVYLGDKSSVSLYCGCGYTTPEKGQWKLKPLLAYISDPEGYAGRQAEEYIANNQERILFGLLCRDILQKEYTAILANTEDPIHTIKKISAAVSASGAKTVNVTISKNGTEQTFKLSADSLKGDCGRRYDIWSLTKAETKRFEEFYGWCVSGYDPKDVVRITYGKRTLYEANPANVG